MISANELRIGNVLNYKIQGCNWYLSAKDILWCSEDNYAFGRNFEPIPLTEEILLKCGFEKGYLSYNLDGFELLYNDVIGYRFAQDGQYGWGEIKYLHQLQNLYFALTGKELNIDLLCK